MTNILIRGLSDEAVLRLDVEASGLGLSRNEYLRRKLEDHAEVLPIVEITDEDWQRSAAVFGDLADPSVMSDAWR